MSPLVRLLGHLGRYKTVVAWTAVCLVGTSLLGLVTPWLIQGLIDKTVE